jgi:putative transcriptional regulator
VPSDADISAITVHLDDLLEAQGMTLTELADRVGLTLANLSILKTGKARAIRFTTLAGLCAELHCQPGDLLRYEPQPAESAGT